MDIKKPRPKTGFNQTNKPKLLLSYLKASYNY